MMCTRFVSDVEIIGSGSASVWPEFVRISRVEDQFEDWCIKRTPRTRTQGRGFVAQLDATGRRLRELGASVPPIAGGASFAFKFPGIGGGAGLVHGVHSVRVSVPLLRHKTRLDEPPHLRGSARSVNSATQTVPPLCTREFRTRQRLRAPPLQNTKSNIKLTYPGHTAAHAAPHKAHINRATTLTVWPVPKIQS